MQLYEHAKDWSDLFVTQLLAQPLFVETPQRGIKTNLVEKLQRVGKCRWQLTLRRDVYWSDGCNLTARDVCEQIARAGRVKGIASVATSLVRSLRILNQSEVEVITRVPVAHLDRILANPGLAPRRCVGSAATRPYVLDQQSYDQMIIRPIGEGRTLQLRRVGASDCEALFDKGQLDIWGPMMTLSSRWNNVVESALSLVYPLDIVFALILPTSINAKMRVSLQRSLDRASICEGAYGAVRPCQFLSNIWTNGSAIDTPHPIVDLPHAANQTFTPELHYTQFPPNHEIALGVTHQLVYQTGISIKPRMIQYGDFASGGYYQHGNIFKLVLLASPWPHPSSLLTPFYLGTDATSDFKKLYELMIAEEDLNIAATLAVEAENVLIESGSRLIPIGQAIGCVRSRIPAIWHPPSGWTDYIFHISPSSHQEKV